MLFLIEYDRNRGELVTFRSFPDTSRTQADDARLELELGLSRRGLEREVVLLEAPAEEDLRRTHRRYFEGLRQLTDGQNMGVPARVSERSAGRPSAEGK
jgi:hypothetical protein